MRMRRVAAALAIASLTAIVSAERASAAPKKVADEPYAAEFRARVRKAIERGVEYVRTRQIDMPLLPRSFDETERDDYKEAAAVTWVLRRAGVAAEDPAFAAAAKSLRARPPKNVEEAALLIFALASPPLADGDPFAIETAAGKRVAPVVSKDDRALIDRAVQYLVGAQVTREPEPALAGDPAFRVAGGWAPRTDLRYPAMASTYLALLGLEAAARVGVTIPPKAFVSAATLLVGWQAPTGTAVTLQMNEVRGAERLEWTEKAQARGFGHAGTASDEPTGFETVGAAVALVVCQDALQKEKTFTKDLRQKTRTSIRDALAWVQQNYDIEKNPSKGSESKELKEGLYHHHWLQGLARLAIHARMRFVGTHDWYAEGAEVLLKSQRGDGSWHPIWWENCYALLFLMRASLHSTVPVVTEPR